MTHASERAGGIDAMRLLGIRVLTAAGVLVVAVAVAGAVASLQSGNAIWIVVALELIIVVGILLGLRSIRNAVRALSVSITTAAAVPSPVTYAPGEPLDLLRRDLQRDVSALLGLHALVGVPGRLPAPGGWAATPDTLLALVSEIRRADRIGTVVECGSGTSTVWMALALRERGEGRLVSLEHDETYAEQTRRQLAALDLADLVDVRHGRLAQQTIEGRTLEWFDDTVLDDIDDVSLLFVDGPPGHLGAMVRFPAFPRLRSRLVQGAIVVLDDVDRDDERAVLDAWLRLPSGGPGLQLRSMTDRAAILVYGGPVASGERHA